MYAFVAAFFAALVLPVTGLPYEPREAVASPTPCSQNYVCPQPIAYPGVADTGDVPPVDQFKCRIGSSSSDPNFAFCYYNKVNGLGSRARDQFLTLTLEHRRIRQIHPEWVRRNLLDERHGESRV
jgi:hypothetical protein